MPLGTNDIVHIVYKGSLFNQTVLTNFSYRVTSSTSTGTIAQDQLDIATALANAAHDMVTKLRALMTADYSLTDVTCQRILPVRMTIASFATGGLAGTRAGTCDTANVAAVFTRKTAFAGRKQRSTIHLPGVSNADIASGALSAGYIADLTTYALETRDAQTIAASGGGNINLQPVIVHRPLGAANFDDIVDADVNNLCRTMRRRTVGLGI